MSNCQKYPVPFGGGVAKIFRVGIQSGNGQIGAYYNVEKPDLIFSDKSSHHRAVQLCKAESAPQHVRTRTGAAQPGFQGSEVARYQIRGLKYGLFSRLAFHTGSF
jgi:hypothetical protein